MRRPICPDEAKSTRNPPPHAAGPPYPALLGLENGSWFPNTACSAIVGGAIWGMSGKARVDLSMPRAIEITYS